MVSTRARCGRCRGHIGAPKAPRKLFSPLKGEAYNFALFRRTLLGDQLGGISFYADVSH